MQNPMFYRHILDLYLRYICFSFYFWHISGDQPMWRLCPFIALKLFPGLKYLITELILIFFITDTMSECHFEDMFFLELPFWVWHIPFLGGALEVLKKNRSLGPLDYMVIRPYIQVCPVLAFDNFLCTLFIVIHCSMLTRYCRCHHFCFPPMCISLPNYIPHSGHGQGLLLVLNEYLILVVD